MTTSSDLDVHTALRMSWASLRRYKGMMFTLLLASLAIAAAYLALRPGAYSAVVRVLVDNRVLAIAQPDAVYSTSALTPQLVQSQVEILRSEGLARRVIERLNLMQAPEYASRMRPENEGATPELRMRQALDVFKRRLSVDVVAQSHVVEVRYTAQDPQRAADVANALVNAYLEEQGTANSAAAQASSGWLRNSMRALGTSGRVLTSATAPVNRDGPSSPAVLAFATMCGVLLGASLALLRGFLDQRMRTSRDVAMATGQSPIAVLPFVRRSKHARPLLTWALSSPKSRFASGLRRLRFGDQESTRALARVVGITGLRASSGATVVSANLARAAAKSGRRVLLVDASRFSGTLTDLAEDGDQPQATPLIDAWSGLNFLSLLHESQPGVALGDALTQYRDAFDLVVVDMPPVEPVPDTLDLVPHLDEVVVVVPAGEVTPDELQAPLQAAPQLRARLAGVVLNKATAEPMPKASQFYFDERFTAPVPPLSFARPDRSAAEAADRDGMPALAGGLQPDADAARGGGGIALHSTILSLVFGVVFAVLAGLMSPAAADDYRLGAGDKLRIKVSEWPDLTGEYTLGSGDALSLPVIGNIEAKGRTVNELADAISRQLQARGDLPAPPTASVAIVSYRPFFVLGDVQKPGEYPSRPGLTVLQAVSVAGGYYRPLDTAFRLERDAIAARNDIGHESRVVRRIAARVARLEAEEAESDTITPPAGFDTASDSTDQTLLAEEQAILVTNKEALAKLLASLDHYKELYELEIKAVTEQIATERQQASAVQRELESLRGLAERGLSPLTRQLTTERTLAQISGTIQGLQAIILRARQNIGLTEQRRIDALNARTTRIKEGLQKARADEKDALQRLRTAKELLQEAEIIAPGMQASAHLRGVEPNYSIVRTTPEGTSEIRAERTTELLPGDVLTVDRNLRAGLQQSSAQGQRTRAAVNNEGGR